jgi:hypothetical protein
MSLACQRSPDRAERARWLRTLWLCVIVLGLWTRPASAHWPPAPESDGVYGRLGGNTDLSLKLGGLLSQSQFLGSIGASAHYYSLIGATLDYSESLSPDADTVRSFSFGTELRPLFFPRWLLGTEHGPAWLDLTLDSICLGFGAYFAHAAPPVDDSHGVWMSIGLGAPLLGRASGPWLEVREVRRWPDHDDSHVEAHNALLVYLSWHQLLQFGQAH